jgi:N-acetylmuramoyl-L-alanine amidase
MLKNIVILKLAVVILLFGLIFSSCKSTQSIFKKSTPLTIVIDPGHGGSDKGSTGPTGLKEKNINLKVALRLKRYLQDDNFKVIMTRTNDKFLSPGQRSAIANRSNGSIFISIHHNHYPYSYINGSKIYVKKRAGIVEKDLAKKIQSSIVSQLGLKNMGLKPYEFYVLDHTNMTSVLTEPSFISNYKNESLLKSAEGQDKEAKGIYLGLKKFIEEK